MARTATKDVTEAELALLEGLWSSGPATIRQLTADVYGDSGVSSYATVQKLLERLEAKGCVRRERGPIHYFQAAIDREVLIGRRLREVADALCGGSLTPLLTHLVKGEGLSTRERDELRRLIDDLDGDKAKSTAVKRSR